MRTEQRITRPTHRSLTLAGAFIALLTAALAPACKPQAGGYCARLCECTECQGSQRGDCIDSITQGRELAENKGCGSEFDDYLSCSSAALACDSGQIALAGSCEAQEDALQACGGTIGLGCQLDYQRLLARYTECGIDVGAGETGPCPPEAAQQIACYAECTEQASCGALNGADPAGQADFADCVSVCF